MYNIPLVEVGEGGSEIGLGKLNLLPILNSSSSCTSGNVACKAFIRACLCMKNQFDIISKHSAHCVLKRVIKSHIYFLGDFDCVRKTQSKNSA